MSQTGTAVVVAALAAVAGTAHASVTVTFEGLEHGRIVNNQFFGTAGLTVSADNFNRAFDLAAIFDSRQRNTADPDLEGPPWSRGNLAPGAQLGNLLILAENNRGAATGVLSDPDDEGNRPAGELVFTFNRLIDRFGFDLIDVEGTMQENARFTFFRGVTQVGQVALNELTVPANARFDPTLAFGDRSANRIQPFTAASFGAVGFDKVVFRLGGSGAIDNIVIPAPGAAALALAGVLVAARRRRA